MEGNYDINFIVYPEVLDGKPIIISSSNNTSSKGYQHAMKSFNFTLNRQNPVDPLVIELVPTGNEQSWMDILSSNDYFKLEIAGEVEFEGLIDSINHTSGVGQGVRYSVKCSDLGVVFSNYVKLIFSKYFAHVTYNKDASTSEFIDDITKKFKNIARVSITDPRFLKSYWEVFFDMFEKLISTTKEPAGPYTFSDKETIYDKFGTDGADFFEIAETMNFEVPLFVNPFQHGDTDFFTLLKGLVQEPYQEIYMSRFNKRFPITIGNVTQYLDGFKCIIRPSLFHPDEFSKFPANVVLDDIMLINVTVQKHNNEMFSIFNSNADMTHLGTASSYGSGKPKTSGRNLKKYGAKVLEVPIKSGVDSANSVDGGQLLQEMFEFNDKKFSGVIKTPYLSIKPGMTIQFGHNFGNGKKHIKALVDGIQAVYNVGEAQPPEITLQFIRGEVVDAES